MRLAYALLVLCMALPAYAQDTFAVPQLALERTLTFEGVHNEIGGSLFHPTAVVRSSGYKADSVLIALGADGKPTSTHAGGSKDAHVGFSSNGRFAVVWETDKIAARVEDTLYQATLYELPGMREVWTQELRNAFGRPYISNDGRVVVLAATHPSFPHYLKFFDESGRMLKHLGPPLGPESKHPSGTMTELALAPSGAYLAVATGAMFSTHGDPPGTITLYDKTGERITSYTPSESTPRAVYISPNESYIATVFRTGGDSTTMQMFDRRLNPLFSITEDGLVADEVSFSPEGIYHAISTPRRIQLRETATGRKLWETPTEELVSCEGQVAARSVVVGRSADRVAALVARNLQLSITAQALVVFDKKGKIIAKSDLGPYPGGGGHGIKLEISQDNRRVALRYWDGTIRHYVIPVSVAATK